MICEITFVSFFQDFNPRFINEDLQKFFIGDFKKKLIFFQQLLIFKGLLHWIWSLQKCLELVFKFYINFGYDILKIFF